MLAISTAWLHEPINTVEEFVALLTRQGFREFEFNYTVHPLDLAQIQRLRATWDFDVVSIHNICATDVGPLEPDDHYGDNLAALDETVRRQSVMHLRATAEAAQALGAKAVVVHAGSVPEAKSDAGYWTMRSAFMAGEIPLSQFREEMRGLFLRRKLMARPYLEQLVKSLREVCGDYPSLQFGLECRYHYYSLPDIDEVGEILEFVGEPNVGYWHDCGHAQVQDNLGIANHLEWLERYGDRLVGIHLHGMGDLLHDHYAPSAGNMPFELLKPFVCNGAVSVLELGHFNPLEAIVAGRDYLMSLYFCPADESSVTQ